MFKLLNHPPYGIPGILLLIAAPFLFVGCSGGESQGPALYTVTGTVQFDGTPIEEGRILFRTKGGAGKAFSAEIKDGEYELESEPGEATVEVTASRVIPGKFGEPASPDEPPPPLAEMYIPEKYNTKTELTVQVTEGDNTIPFMLESK